MGISHLWRAELQASGGHGHQREGWAEGQNEAQGPRKGPAGAMSAISPNLRPPSPVASSSCPAKQGCSSLNPRREDWA